MAIRTKLYAAILVTVLGLTVAAGVGIWGMSRVGDRFDAVQHVAAASSLALQLKFDVTDFNGWQTAYGYDNGRSRPEFLRSVARFRTDLAHARASVPARANAGCCGGSSPRPTTSCGSTARRTPPFRAGGRRR